MDYIHHTVHDLWIQSGHIIILMDVHTQVIKERNPLFHNQFPVIHTDCNLVGLMKLPIKELMLLLPAVITGKSRCE